MSKHFESFVRELNEKEIRISMHSLHLISDFFEKHDLFKEEKILKESIAVSKILLEVRCDEDMFLASLLYKFFEHNEERSQELKRIFGESVFKLTESLNKMKKIESLAYEKDALVLRKIFIAMSDDLRVIFIKLAEKLAIVRSCESLPSEEKKICLRKILSIYVPIATRLGAYYFKNHLEEGSFQILFPQNYKEISKKLKRYSKKQEQVLKSAKKQIKMILSHANLPCYDIEYRVKRKYSIWEKMKKNNEKDIENIYDIFAIRIITNTVEHCYKILGLVHKQWTPIQNRIKDYIAVPKANGYQSIHTTLLGLGTNEKNYKPVEIQIRTQEMHEEAERGFAAHWVYKEKGGKAINKQWMLSLKDLAENVSQLDDELLEDVHDTSLHKRVFVLTPKGDVKDLPLESTPIDFAYAVSSNLGNHIVESKVNGIKVPLDSVLLNGDIIEVKTHENRTPNPAWINVVKTAKARLAIQSWLKSQAQEDIMDMGVTELNKFLKKLNRLELDDSCGVLAHYQGKDLSLKDRKNLVKQVGAGNIKAADVIGDIVKPIASRKKLIRETGGSQVLVMGEKSLKTRIASCCKPTEINKIVGYTTRGGYISIHRSTCSFVSKAEKERLIECYWSGDGVPFEVEFSFRIQNVLGAASKVLHFFAKNNINLLNTDITTDKTLNIADGKILTQMKSLDRLNWLSDHLNAIDGVVSVDFLVKN